MKVLWAEWGQISSQQPAAEPPLCKIRWKFYLHLVCETSPILEAPFPLQFQKKSRCEIWSDPVLSANGVQFGSSPIPTLARTKDLPTPIYTIDTWPAPWIPRLPRAEYVLIGLRSTPQEMTLRCWAQHSESGKIRTTSCPRLTSCCGNGSG